MERILIGGLYSNGSVSNALFEFSNADLKSVEMLTGISLVSDELVVDELNFTVAYHHYLAELFAPADFDAVMSADGYLFATNTPATADIGTLKFGVPVWYYNNDNLMGKFYVSKILRKNKYDYQISCVSAIGVLKGRNHMGGVYTGALGGDTVGDVLASIMDDGSGSPIIPYTIDAAVANTYVYGWLPVAPKRENLHQLLFAYAVTLIKNADGSMRFTFLSDASTYAIPDSKIFYSGSVDLSDLATKVEVTEHSFRALADDKTETLFDNSDGTSGTADHTLVYFPSAPCHGVTASGLTVHELGDNYAIVSGTGTLTGQVYTHVTQVLSKSVDDYDTENVRSVTDATLVTPINSANVVDRLLAYYSKKRTVSMDIVLETEKCGDQVSFTNPYGEADAGYIVGLDINASSFLRARASIITGYNAQGFGNYYSHAVLLTGNGTWTAPQGAAEKIRVVMVGGGHGGDGGYDGEAGEAGSASSSSQSYGRGGRGGQAGIGGEGGNILTEEIDTTPGATFAYSCGVGGIGGARNGGVGQAGGNTTFGVYSSASGSPSAAGAVDLINGGVYGTHGASGVKGGDGASDENPAGSVSYRNQTWQGGAFGGVADYVYVSGTSTVYFYDAFGGCGGGAAFGQSGASARAYIRNRNGVEVYALGANGASAASPAPAAYGAGGNGGHGGGGGGGGGWSDVHQRTSDFSYRGHDGGAGGQGSAGGAGGAGVIIVYY